jgi:DNA-binding winged helix-turn-helix (wHTH) protein
VAPAEDDARRGLHVDWEARRISVDGTPVRLTPMEWKALERLAVSPGELVPHVDLFRRLSGEDKPYRAQSTAFLVMITKLRRLLPPLHIKAQWGRGYIVRGIAIASPRGTPQVEAGAEPPAKPAPPRPEKPRELAALSRSSIEPDRTVGHPKLRETSHPEKRRPSATAARPSGCRADEIRSIERFLAERGVTRCHDVATTLVWDKVKRKWVRPPTVIREVS